FHEAEARPRARLTRESGEATLGPMSRPPARPTAADSDPDRAERAAPEVDPGLAPAGASGMGSLSDLPVAGLTRRRVALLLGALIAAWIVVLFARQVSEASEASSHADAM